MPRYALMADRVWDGVTMHAAEGLAVVINNTRIEAVIPVGETPPELPRVMPRLKHFLARAHAQGVVTALGTDTPFPHLIPGFSVHDELAMYVDAGLRPVEALRAATAVNAQVLGLAQSIGRIAAGLTADLVAIQGNPLQSIDAISDVHCTIHAGQIFTPSALLPIVQRTFTEQPEDAITRDLLAYVNSS